VDGIIATAFVDLFRQSGAFSPDVSHRVSHLSTRLTASCVPFFVLPISDHLSIVIQSDDHAHHRLYIAQEAMEYINIGILNGLFVLGRSIGFIGHYIDQKRLKQVRFRSSSFIDLDSSHLRPVCDCRSSPIAAAVASVFHSCNRPVLV
jgi:hypothetical protein